MKRFVALFLLLYVGSVAFAETTHLDATLAGPWNIMGKDSLTGWKVRVNIGLSYTLSTGMSLSGNQEVLLFDDKGKAAPNFAKPTLTRFVAKERGTWSVWKTDAQGVLRKYKVTNAFDGKFDEHEISTANLPIPNLPVSFVFDVAVVNTKDPVPTFDDNPIPAAEAPAVFDPRTVDNQTFYFMTNAMNVGVKLKLHDLFDFEAVPLLSGFSQEQIRATVTYWLLNTQSLDDANQSKYGAQLPDFTKRLFDILNDPSNTAQTMDLRFKALTVLKTVLEWKTQISAPAQMSQSWGFPTASLYLKSTDPGYVGTAYEVEFFRVLALTKNLVSLNDIKNPAAIDQSSAAVVKLRSDLASRAIDYLYGVESNSNPLADQYQSIQLMPQGTADSALYDPRAQVHLTGTNDHLLDASRPDSSGASSFEFTIPNQSASTSTFANAMVFFPPSPNLLNSDSLVSPDSVTPLLSPVGILADASSSTIDINWKSSVSASSLLLWLGNDAEIGTIKILSQGSLLDVTNQIKTTTYATLGLKNLSYTLVAGKGTGATLCAVNFTSPLQTSRLVLTLKNGNKKVYNLRVYGSTFDLIGGSSQWSRTDRVMTIFSYYSKQLPEVFTTTGGNNFPYFLQAGSSFVGTSASSDLPAFFSPIRYLAAGMETPRSYDLKVINNKFFSTQLGLKTTHFSLTELDLDRQGTIDSQFLYKNFQLPAKPYVSVTNSFTENLMYPYAFGIDIPSKTGNVTKPNSPFFVEKLAGVDSVGMLVSLLKTLNWGVVAPAWMQTRFDSRVKLASYNSVKQGTPWANYPADVSYTWDKNWFLQNSYVVADLDAALPGDLLVGYEGNELVAGIVVQIDSGIRSKGSFKVVTINRGSQKAYYTRWSTMSTNPDAYHIRRLVVSNLTGVDKTPSNIDGFLNFSPMLNYTLARSDDPDNFKQWLPNTGELGQIGQIRITAQDVTIPQGLLDGSSWSVQKVWDYYGDQQALGNIAKNTTKSRFHLLAVSDDQSHETGVKVSLVADPAPATTSWVNENGVVDLFQFDYGVSAALGNYTTIPHSSISAAWEFVVGQNQGNTVLELRKKDDPSVLYTKFAIVAFGQDGKDPIPGDDIGVSFVVNSSFGQWFTSETTAPRLAVYDKKMLWRANLFIEEAAGGADWNDRHPWISDNQWNKYYDISDPAVSNIATREGLPTVDSAFVVSHPNLIAGGQAIKVVPFTMKWDNKPTFSSKAGQKNVGYFIAGYDSPFLFNEKMVQQKWYQNQWYVDAVATPLARPIVNWTSVATIQALDLATIYQWTFPSNIWATVIPQFGTLSANDKLVKAKNKMISWYGGSGATRGTVAPAAIWNNYVADYFVNNAGSAPFRPGLVAEFDPDSRGQITGADCVGFVQRSASYFGNAYPWVKINENTFSEWTTSGDRSFGYPTAGSDSDIVATSLAKDWIAGQPNLDPSILGLKYIVPGDVVRFVTSDGRHFAMARQVLQNPNQRVSLAGIQLIESTHNTVPLITGATNIRSMAVYEDRRYADASPYLTWDFYRLRVNGVQQ